MVHLLLAAVVSGWAAPPTPPTPEERALAYLVHEVPRWARENRCYACHHNGDAARALIAARRRGLSVPDAALADTLRWLTRPDRWDHNGGEGVFSDKKLARLHFAAALADAREAGLVRAPGALEMAARLVAEHQDADGSWKVIVEGNLGSPTTHGTTLATHLGRSILLRGDARRHRQAIARADAWLRRAPIDTVLDASALLLALGREKDPAARKQQKQCLEMIRKGEARGGGWGPFVRSAPEAFDTALVLLALATQEPTAEVQGWIRRGRTYLLAMQEKDGSWEETTRPAGAVSHPQRLSTTGWAVLALLATSSRKTAP